MRTVGAGPAGLFAGIRAAQEGAEAMIFERLPAPGRKLLASGGGRCNLCNALDVESFMERFGPRGRFMSPALQTFGRDELLDAMTDWGVPCVLEEGARYFPASGRSRDVLDALERVLLRLGVRIRAGEGVESIEIADHAVRGLRLASGREVEADSVIMACGGMTYPALGGSEWGYDLARQAGHSIVTPLPALAPLRTLETWPGECAGIGFPEARAWIDEPRERNTFTEGGMVFTHRGVSGPALLDLSGRVARLLEKKHEVRLRIRFLPEKDWAQRFAEGRKVSGTRHVHNLLAGFLPRALAVVLCREAGLDDGTPLSRLPRDAEGRLVEWLTACPLTVVGVEGIDQAMVSAGGVALKEVDPKTLESRLVRGLYFAGEVLDLDGPCGGFNLQWAASSGTLAGQSASRAP